MHLAHNSRITSDVLEERAARTCEVNRVVEKRHKDKSMEKRYNSIRI
jgi:hypothetical protein